MSKLIVHNQDARDGLLRGVNAVAGAVKITIGPRGRNVVLEKTYGAPTITNDGVSIAKEITLKDPIENMGAEIVKEVASKTNEIAGDGTTTSVILTQAIASLGMAKAAMGANSLMIRRGIEKATQEVVSALRSMAKPIKGKEEIKNVATISAESAEIGEIIARTVEKVGPDGVVTVEESQSFGVESDVVQGISFEKGYVSHYMLTNTERMEAEYKNPYVLVTEKRITSIKEILPLLEKLAGTGKKELVIIAEDIDGEALTTFVVNKLRGTFSVLGIKAPGYGDAQHEELEDIAITLGATLVTESAGMSLEQADLSVLGSASRIVATKDKTVIVGGKGKKKDIDKRISQLRGMLEDAKYKYDKERIQKRIAKLAGGVAVVRVGAPTETEMKYLKLKIEDAVNATRAAIEEGIVPGGGVALVKAGLKVQKAMANAPFMKKAHTSKREAEFAIGYQALLSALSEPLRQIAINAGRDDGSVVVDRVRSATGDAMGYDANEDTTEEIPMMVDMLKAGIIDPVKVTRTALENAASAAGILLTTEVAIAEDKKEIKNIHEHSELG